MQRPIALVLLAALACRGDGRSATPPGDPAAPPSRAIDAAARARVPHPVTPALLDGLAALAVPGHDVRVLARGASDLALAIDRPLVIITASACLGCVALDLESWRARRAELAALWAPGADAEPPPADAHLAISALDLGAGEHAILIDAQRADGTAVTVAHWNDGALQLQAVCEQPAAACRSVTSAALAAAVTRLVDL